MNKVLDGGLYALGALIACTVWYGGAMLIQKIRVDSAVAEMNARDEVLLEYGPGASQAERELYRALYGEQVN